jgi:PAS domain S-box-containing protein
MSAGTRIELQDRPRRSSLGGWWLLRAALLVIPLLIAGPTGAAMAPHPAVAQRPAVAPDPPAEPSVWERHRNVLLISAGVIGLQSAMILAVLMQNAKRRRAEQSLKESEERTAFAAASTHIGLWQRDVGRDGLWSTEHCRAMFGVAADAPLTLEAMLDVVAPDDRDTFAKSMRAAIHGGLPPWRDFRVAVGGQIHWINARAQPRYDDAGKLLRVSGVFADVTARKSAEVEIEQQRGDLAHLMRVSLLGELSGAIAHEINQPLTAILANAQAGRRMLTMPQPDLALLREVLDDIVQEDNRAGEVIRRLRGLLRKGEHKSEILDLNSLVASTLQLMHSELVSRKTRVDSMMFDDLAPVEGDPVQLQQVLLNLMINAADSMGSLDPGERLVSISTRAGAERAEVIITDRGHGIRPGQEKLLFQPFFTTKPQGLGLGLSICSTIVTAHGGELRITNNPDGGATATLRLPMQVQQPLRTAAE